MKIFSQVILGIWCAVTYFVSPIWLVMILLYISGQIHKYDFSIDERIAGLFGTILLVIWLLIVLLPCLLFIKRMYAVNHMYMFIALIFTALPAVICTAMCNWNIVEFLTTPGGVKFGF